MNYTYSSISTFKGFVAALNSSLDKSLTFDTPEGSSAVTYCKANDPWKTQYTLAYKNKGDRIEVLFGSSAGGNTSLKESLNFGYAEAEEPRNTAVITLGMGIKDNNVLSLNEASTNTLVDLISDPDKIEKPAGEGTQSKPFEISTVHELVWFEMYVNGRLTDYPEFSGNSDYTGYHPKACAKLNDDIDLSTYCGEKVVNDYNDNGSWVPIGRLVTDDNVYTGTFDGNNKTIDGLYVNTANKYAGLFGSVEYAAIIKNVKLGDKCSVKAISETSKVSVGAIAGYNYGTIENCTNNGQVEASSAVARVGGIIGYNDGTISNCINSDSVKAATSQGAFAGGIAGFNNYISTISNCTNSGSIKASTLVGYIVYVGGITGYNSMYDNKYGSIASCTNSGSIEVSISSSIYAGGIAGFNNSTILDCTNSGPVKVTSSERYAYAGGVIGYNKGTIKRCINSSAVESATDSMSATAGGIASYNIGGTITNCTNSNVVKASTKSSSSVYAGGVTSFNRGGTVTDCTNNDSIVTSSSSSAYAGGIIGYTDNYSTISNCENNSLVNDSSSPEVYIGGIIGQSIYSTIENCRNKGSVTYSVTSSKAFIGGIAGYHRGTISNCTNSGSVTYSSSSSTSPRVGGIIGDLDHNGIIKNCYYVKESKIYKSTADGFSGKEQIEQTDRTELPTEFDGKPIGNVNN